MPFGLSSAPAVFSRYISEIFRSLTLERKILIYMDDIIIPSENEDCNLKVLRDVLTVASQYNLQIKWEKCTFLSKKIEYLGYEITKGTIMPSRSKTEAVKKFPEPRKLKNVQSYLGLTGYFRKFIKNYAEIARPLTNLLRKDVQFEFGPIQKEAFQKLKQCLIEYPVLRIFHPDRKTEVHTDASKWGFGAILMQMNRDDQQFHPIYYFSRKTTPAQERYHSYELEVLAIVAALKKFRIYLLGLNFTIVTDCAAFKATMEKKDLLPRIAGWAIFLQDFSYKIEHRSGTRMRHSDALSRNPIVALLEDGLLQRIGNAQQTDDRLRIIKESLAKGPLDPYYLRNGIVYRRGEDGHALVCIPKGMQQEIIKTVHEKGHFGWRKTVELLKRDYYISHLKEKIESCIYNCIPCILAERKTGKKECLLNPIPKDDFPLKTYHLDHLGPLTTTNKQYKYILTIIDAFSKFVWMYAVKTLTAKEVISKLQIQKTVFGNPEQVVTDRGTAFTAGEFQDYLQTESIKQVLITTGVPRGNGQVERVHRIVIPALTKLSLSNPEKWYTHLDNLQRFLNSSWQRSIARSPFELLFGVKMRNREDVRIAELLEEAIIDVYEEERQKSREEAKQQIVKVQADNKRNYDRNRKVAFKYQNGDIVAIKKVQFGSGQKIQPKFLGPYRIVEVRPNDRYQLEKIGETEGPSKTFTSADNIKSWRSCIRSEEFLLTDDDADVISEEED